MEELRLILAYDQGLELGPSQAFNQKNVDPAYILDIAKRGGFDAVVLQKGVAEKYYNHEVPLILKLNGKTKLYKGEPRSVQIASVQEARDLGAIGVGYTIYLGSEFESDMLKEFGRIEEEAHALSLLVIGWMYPRGQSVSEPNSPENIAYAARAGLELGADYVKIKYPGTVEALRWAVSSAGKTKVLVSGGAKLNPEDFYKFAKEIISAGANGLAVGRNVWQAKEPLQIAKELKKIIFLGAKK